LATLLRKGLLQPSYIPPPEIRALRDLCRAHSNLVHERVRVVQRIQGLLETANLKLDSVISDVMGKSGRQMLQALAEGQTDPEKLAEYALGRMRSKKPELVAALEGHLRPQQRFILREWLAHFDALSARIEKFLMQIQEYARPFEAAVARLMQMPGLDRLSATKLMAETGADLAAFPSPEQFSSWATVCPGNRRSAGKQRSGRTRQGNPWLRSIVTECAWAASRSKDTYFYAQYHRLAPRIGKNRAIMAVAHSMLYVIWHLLTQQVDFRDLGGDYFQTIKHEGQTKAWVRKLQKLGYRVTLELAA
jgi:transposase